MDEAGSTHPETGVVIGLGQIWQTLIELKTSVDRLNDHLDNHRKQLDDHESRLRKLEGARWPLPAVALVVSILAVAAAVYQALHGH